MDFDLIYTIKDKNNKIYHMDSKDVDNKDNITYYNVNKLIVPKPPDLIEFMKKMKQI